MRAFVAWINPLTGRDALGTAEQWVTPEYISLKNLARYFLMNPARVPGYYHVQAYTDWGNRYRVSGPDYDLIFNKDSWQNGYWLEPTDTALPDPYSDYAPLTARESQEYLTQAAQEAQL